MQYHVDWRGLIVPSLPFPIYRERRIWLATTVVAAAASNAFGGRKPGPTCISKELSLFHSMKLASLFV